MDRIGLNEANKLALFLPVVNGQNGPLFKAFGLDMIKSDKV
jgi:hypothetical protein